MCDQVSPTGNKVLYHYPVTYEYSKNIVEITRLKNIKTGGKLSTNFWTAFHPLKSRFTFRVCSID